MPSPARSQLDYQPGDQPVPGYTLVRPLGSGSMGVVWLARNQRGLELALKIVGLEHSGGRKEWRGLAIVRQRQIHHGNLLRLYDYWLKDREGNLVADIHQSLAGSSFSLATAASRRAQTVSTARANICSTLGRRTLGGEESHELATSGGQQLDSQQPDSQQLDFQQPEARPTEAQPVQLLLAMDLGDETLNDVGEKQRGDGGGGVPIDELMRYMRQAASGLDHLHEAGIVHRDVKPHNIMLVGGVATIADYGLAIASDIDVKATSNAFSAAYASPEAVAWRDTSPPLSGKADQYSLAVTYYELRTGRLPYFHETLTSLYTAKETGKYDLSRIENKAVRAVLKRALSRSPGSRYATCGELVRALDRAEHSRGGAQAALTLAAALIVMLVSALAAYPAARLWLARGKQSRQDRHEEVARQSAPVPADDNAASESDYHVQLVAAGREAHGSTRQRRQSPAIKSPTMIDRYFVSPRQPALDETAAERFPTSREPAADELVNLAEAQLTPDEPDDLPSLFEISTERAIAASEHLAAARKVRGDDAYLQGLQAIALAIPAMRSTSAANWPRIAKLADSSLAGSDRSDAARRSHRLDAVKYVRALATARLQNHDH